MYKELAKQNLRVFDSLPLIATILIATMDGLEEESF
jgi:hypothetical protein